MYHSNRTVNFFYWSKNVFSHSEVLSAESVGSLDAHVVSMSAGRQ